MALEARELISKAIESQEESILQTASNKPPFNTRGEDMRMLRRLGKYAFIDGTACGPPTAVVKTIRIDANARIIKARQA